MSRRFAVAVVWLLGLGSCGFLAAPRENPEIPPDGLGPYVEVGTVALCQDGVLLEPTGPEASGFCVPLDAPAAAGCATDRDCAAEERCSCGRCVVPYCAGNEECRDGETCILSANRCAQACAVDEDCSSAMRCDRGRCAKTCAGPDDCLRGEFCSRRLGLCVATACSDDGPCADSEHCDAQRARRSFVEPAIVERGGELLLFVEDLDAHAIYRGRGATRTAFELEAVPLATDAAAPAPLIEGDELVLYYARSDRSALLRARGADGELAVAEVVLEPSRAWEGGLVASPSAARFGDETVIAYEGEGGVGLARWQDGTWTGSVAPVVTAAALEDSILWREVSALGSPMLLADRTALGDARLRLWVDARGAEGSATIVGDRTLPPPLNSSIGLATSLDGGQTFAPSPFNPTFARVAELGRYKAESDPWIAGTAHAVVLWYVGSDVESGAPEGLGVAVSGN